MASYIDMTPPYEFIFGWCMVWLMFLAIPPASKYNEWTTRNKVGSNFLSVTHAVSVCLGFLGGFSYQQMIPISMGYYLCDLILIHARWFLKLDKFSWVYLFHHGVCLLGMVKSYESPLAPTVFLGFFLAEFANLPLYICYHLKATKHPNQTLVRNIIWLELFSYFTLRVLWSGYLLIELSQDPLIFSLAFLVFLMSCYWSVGLFKSLFPGKPKKEA